MSIKKILMSAICTVSLLVSTASAENKENTEPWTAPLEAAILEGFGTRFTILLPPIEAYRIGVFSPSPGDGFGFIGNTFPASDSTREIYLGITSENFPASSAHKTAADRLNENVDRFIANMPMLKSKSSHISQDISLSQDGHPARLIRIAISGLIETFSCTNSESAFLLIPNILAASVIDRFNGFRTSSRNTFPGCVGFLFMVFSFFLLMVVLIIHQKSILLLKVKCYKCQSFPPPFRISSIKSYTLSPERIIAFRS